MLGIFSDVSDMDFLTLNVKHKQHKLHNTSYLGAYTNPIISNLIVELLLIFTCLPSLDRQNWSAATKGWWRIGIGKLSTFIFQNMKAFSCHYLLSGAAILLALFHRQPCGAFLTGPPGRGGSFNGIGNGNIPPPPRFAHIRPSDWDGSNDPDANLLLATSVDPEQDSNEDDENRDVANDTEIRGGATKQLKGVKSTLSSTASYWSNAFNNAGQTTIAKPFKAVKNKVASLFESKEQQQQKQLIQQLETTKIQSVVIAANSTVVPHEVVQLAARRSGLIGNPLRTDRVQEFAAALKRWYQMRGYVLHSVTGASLKVDSATAEIQVQEPRVHRRPVDITFCKEMVVDEETGNLLTFRQYKERHAKRRTIGHRSISKENANTTFVQTDGKTRSGRIAHALKLKPGTPFQWDPSRWSVIAGSGVFGRILQASPKRMQDGSVQLQILATESPPRHLEYGVSKSLYTGAWEGEIDFQHENLLGGGETLGLMVRRGTKDPEPSVHISFSDDKFGMPGGYEVEAFRDYIGDKSDSTNDIRGNKAGDENVLKGKQSDANSLLDRRGIKFTYRNPISQGKISHSQASTSLERTATQSGIREAIGSGTLALGPFRQQLPMDARSSFDGSFTTGLRIPETAAQLLNGDKSSSNQGLTLLPYSAFTLTTSQIFPLFISSTTSRRQPALAIRHSLSGSTRNLPRHEQNAMGFSSTIRGGRPHGRISTSVVGSTELRIPLELDIPILEKVQDGASLVLFGDWVSTRNNNGSPFSLERSIGIGARKAVQGIPLKVDISYAGGGKIKSSFGLGRDFDV